MKERPERLRALDKLADLGNRSTGNPFLARSFELFFTPFGITAKSIEYAFFQPIFGFTPPIYTSSLRFDGALVRQKGTYVGLFEPLLSFPGHFEVGFDSGIRFTLKLRPTAVNTELPIGVRDSNGLRALESTLNSHLERGEEYFRGFVTAAVLALIADGQDNPLHRRFLEDPGDYARGFAESLSQVTA